MRFLSRFTLVCLLGQLLACDVGNEAPHAATVDVLPSSTLPDAAVSPRDAGHARPPAPVAGHDMAVPCAVAEVLREHCGKCHGEVPVPGVPISLVSYADLTARTTTGATVIERVKARIHETQRPMPPVREMDPLGPDELATLDAWIAAGAPASTDTCAQADTQVDAGADDYAECEYLPVLTAHNGQHASDTEGFEVPLVDTTYECFNFAIPWDEPVQALAFYPVIGEASVLHHMGLYSLKSPLPPGSHGPCEVGPDRTVVGGWSPGQDKLSWPPEYGALMPHDKTGGFQLEIHYDNRDRRKVRDSSGLKVCATSKFRPKTLAMAVLSSDENINLPPGRQQVVTSCTVWSDKGPATALAASPHMHRLGVRLQTIVKHTDGTQETVTDQPFSFDDQAIQFLKTPVIIKKGDVLTTTCSYENNTGRVIRYSKGSDGEMCNNGLIASPPGSLTGGLAGTLIEAFGVPNLCVGIGPEPVFGL
jgi:hypothetical protein